MLIELCRQENTTSPTTTGNSEEKEEESTTEEEEEKESPKPAFLRETLSGKGSPHENVATSIWALLKLRLHPPPPHSTGHSGALYFRTNLSNFVKSPF